MLINTLLSDPVFSLFDGIDIDQIIEKRRFLLQTYNQFLELLEETNKKFKESKRPFLELMYKLKNFGYYSMQYCGSEKSIELSKENIEKIKSDYDYGIWTLLMKKSNIYHYMDCQSKRNWDKNLHECKFLEVNHKNIIETFKNMYESRAGMLYNFIIDLFKNISFYKNNEKIIELPTSKRIIVTSACCYNKLVIALFIMDKKKILSDNYYDYTYRSINDQWIEAHFSVKNCANGNTHIIFNDTQALKDINLIATSDFEQGTKLINKILFN